MSAAKAVIFDLDDTLFPERAYAFSGFAAVATAFQDRLGDPAHAAADMQRLFETQHRPRVFDALLVERAIAVNQPLVDSMIDVYRTHKPTISLHADADRILTHLSGSYKLGLISDGPSVGQWAKIDALGLPGRFDEIIVTSDLGSGCAKPHPRAFELMAERLDIGPPCCIYVADNPSKDFIAPRALGWRTIKIVRPDGIYRNRSAPASGVPQHVIYTLDDLAATL